ncbi:hypothetical protein [Cytobacillus gottheilii]|uniref:hypothetical protein n=1 Tax=Cytobacillus gottheilii TaxID=859144 RepID=UPI0009B9E11E|nr:hypothetical protein [Cytobacillus gottheilii]
MKLVLYNNESKVTNVIEGVVSPTVKEKDISWEAGFMGGVNLPFLLLDDNVEIGETVTDDMKLLDQTNNCLYVNENEVLKKENEELKERLGATELAIVDLLDIFTTMGGE